MTRAAAALAALILMGAAKPPADVRAFEVVLTPDFDAKTVSGRERVEFTGGSLSFTAPALDLSDVRLDGRPAHLRREGERLTLDAGSGAHVLTLAFSGKPRRGLTFAGDFVWSSYFACDWMVCDQDAPGDKATISIRLILPEGMDGVTSSGRAAVSPHLFGFAAGRLRSKALGQGLRAFAPAGSAADLGKLFGPTAEMAAFFAEKAGAPLPYGGYDQVLVPGQEAQEASSFSLLGEETLTPMLVDPSEDWAIAHELSHQWWGNSVTCADWSELWLNEGFATFMTAAWKEHRWGRPAYDREMAIAKKRWDASTAAGFDKPLAWKGEFPSLKVRRGVQYSKGALFLDALRRELGEADFWKGVKLYTRTHLGGTVTSRDLQRAMERASGRGLQPLFDRWVYG